LSTRHAATSYNALTIDAEDTVWRPLNVMQELPPARFSLLVLPGCIARNMACRMLNLE